MWWNDGDVTARRRFGAGPALVIAFRPLPHRMKRTAGHPGVARTPAHDRATPLLRERVRDVFRRLPRALAGDEDALHDMRVAARRLRVALPLLARKPEGRRVRRSLKVLRQVTRTAGASRDLDVSVALMDARDTEKTASRTTLRRRLRAARTRGRTRMAEALLDLEIAELRRHLRAALARGGDAALHARSLRVRDARDRDGQQAPRPASASTRRDASTRSRAAPRSASGCAGCATPRSCRTCSKGVRPRCRAAAARTCRSGSGHLRDRVRALAVVRAPGRARLAGPARTALRAEAAGAGAAWFRRGRACATTATCWSARTRTSSSGARSRRWDTAGPHA